MIISRTPFRVSFFGGGTDYPTWFQENSGRVLTSTINRYCYLTARFLPPFFDQRSRIVWSKIEKVDSPEEIEHPAVRAALQFMKITEGVEIHHVGDLPARSGLGSSSAFTVGLLHALYALKGQMANKAQLAEDAIYVEQELLKEAVGVQDQIEVAFGGINLVDIRRDGTYQVAPVILSRERVQEFESHLMLFFTGISRFSSELAESQIKAIPDNTRELKAMQQLVEEALGVLIGSQSLTQFGKLLHESWQLKRSLTNKISTTQVDKIYEAARSAGAIGGKLLGAGGGGFMLVFAAPEKQQSVREALAGLLEIPFEFEYAGSQIIFCDMGNRGAYHLFNQAKSSKVRGVV
jgi:D-glycero-alpha-D-manno-heptose-7-phosphate kinase